MEEKAKKSGNAAPPTGTYRAAYEARRSERLADMEAKRLASLDAARQAARHLFTLGASRVLLFGSILAPGRFHARSDLDVLAHGLPPGQWSAALRCLEDWPGLQELDIDLKFAEELPTHFLAFAEAEGEEVQR